MAYQTIPNHTKPYQTIPNHTKPYQTTIPIHHTNPPYPQLINARLYSTSENVDTHKIYKNVRKNTAVKAVAKAVAKKFRKKKK